MGNQSSGERLVVSCGSPILHVALHRSPILCSAVRSSVIDHLSRGACVVVCTRTSGSPAIAIPIVRLTLVLRKPSSCQPTLQQTFKDDGSYSFIGLSIVACQVLLGATWPTTGRWASKASFAHCICDYDVGQAGSRRANRMG